MGWHSCCLCVGQSATWHSREQYRAALQRPHTRKELGLVAHLMSTLWQSGREQQPTRLVAVCNDALFNVQTRDVIRTIYLDM